MRLKPGIVHSFSGYAADCADYQAKGNGSTEILPWHKTFSYINGLDVEFMDW